MRRMASPSEPLPPALPQHGAGAPGPGRGGPHQGGSVVWRRRHVLQEFHSERHAEGEEGHPRKLQPSPPGAAASGQERQRHHRFHEGGGCGLQQDLSAQQAPHALKTLIDTIVDAANA